MTHHARFSLFSSGRINTNSDDTRFEVRSLMLVYATPADKICFSDLIHSRTAILSAPDLFRTSIWISFKHATTQRTFRGTFNAKKSLASSFEKTICVLC